MKIRFLVAMAAIALFVASCPMQIPDPTQDPMTGTVNVIYLHHSTGGVIWGGGVPEDVVSYNAENGTDYQIEERAFPGDGYPWANYPYDYWNIWVRNAGSVPYSQQDTLEILTQAYNVIVFKHCFPVSNIGPDSGTPDVTSEDKTVENYQAQYETLKIKMHEFPNTRFIVWTGAANTQANTNSEEAARARNFFAWVRDVWDEPGDNIYVWDFWTLETNGGLYLLNSNSADGGGDSHPSNAFAHRVAPFFVQRLTDVIEGRGDPGSVTGRY